MANNNKKMMVGMMVGAALVIGVVAFQSGPSPTHQQTNFESDQRSQDNSENPNPSLNSDTRQTKTIATEWQWQNPQDDSGANIENSSPESSRGETLELPFTEQSVFNALQAVKIDEDGHIILDHDALISLDEALERIYGKLDDQKLEILQQMIQAHLPGLAGEQTAELVGNYSNFLNAKDEFSRAYEQVDPNELQSLETLERDESIYQELQALREAYLGKESTDQLFKVSDANALLMFETLKIGADQSLSPEERGDRLTAAHEEHARKTIDIPNWGDRYDSFLTAKQNILDASISDSEKQSQLSSLLNDRFDDQEQALIEHLALDVL